MQTLGGVKIASPRRFGLWFAGIFCAVAIWPLPGGGVMRTPWLIASVGFLLLALLAPNLLQPLNLAWARLGLLMARVTNPIVLGVLFFGVITPVGWLMRMAGKDPLRLKRDASLPTYWIERVPPGPDPQPMARPF
jgi:hypothetical protein